LQRAGRPGPVSRHERVCQPAVVHEGHPGPDFHLRTERLEGVLVHRPSASALHAAGRDERRRFDLGGRVDGVVGVGGYRWRRTWRNRPAQRKAPERRAQGHGEVLVPIGLVGEKINVETGAWTGSDSHISGGIDSYYEYLLKCWLLFADEDCHRMWLESIAAINKYLAAEVYRSSGERELWYGHADMNTGKRTASTYGALDAFFPALLALSGDLTRAQRLQESSFKMWQLNGIEPEEIDYRSMTVTSPGYPLRPEIVESTYYLYRFTQDRRYLLLGAQLFRDFVKYCRTDAGYAALRNVRTKEMSDSMQSFLFAETFKYFYLLFAPPHTLRFEKVIFNTEAHPMRRTRR